MTGTHWPEVARIYQEGIDSGHATFESSPPKSWQEWSEKRIPACSLVATDGEGVLGWAALSPSSDRCVYAGVAEVSIYVSWTARGRGIGSKLLAELICLSEESNIWTLQTGIFPENEASLHLHAKHGFRQVGIREKLGKMGYGPCQGQWRDVGFLERRSQVAGV